MTVKKTTKYTARIFEYICDSRGIFIDMKVKWIEDDWKNHHWFTWPLWLKIQEFLSEIEFDQNLQSLLETRLEEYGLNVWYKIDKMNDRKKLLILLRYFDILIYVPRDIFEYSFSRVEKYSDEIREQVWYFLQANSIMLHVKPYLDFIDSQNKKEEFDSSILDFLEGKIDSPKMVNWGVGQVMKQYPGKYSAKDLKEAIEKRWTK